MEELVLFSALGAFVGALIGIQFDLPWWIGSIIGGAFAGLTYRAKEVLLALRVAWEFVKGGIPGFSRQVMFFVRVSWWSAVAIWSTASLVLFVGLVFTKDISSWIEAIRALYSSLILGSLGLLFPSAFVDAEEEKLVGCLKWFNAVNLYGRVIPRLIWRGAKGLPALIKLVKKAAKTFFVLVATRARILLAANAALGAGVGIIAGNALLGAVVGGAAGMLEWVLFLHTAPTRR